MFRRLFELMAMIAMATMAAMAEGQVGLIVIPIDIAKPFRELTPSEIVIPFKDGNTKLPAAPSVVRCDVNDETTGVVLYQVDNLVATLPCAPSNFVCGVRVRLPKEANRIVDPIRVKKYQNEIHTLTCQYWFTGIDDVVTDGYVKTTFPVMNLGFAPMVATATPTRTPTFTLTNTPTRTPTSPPPTNTP